jgi:hypothetical protein
MSRNFNPSCAAFHGAVPFSLRTFLLFMGGLAITVLAPSGTTQKAPPQRTPRAASAGPRAQSDATSVVLAQEQQAPIPRPLLTMDARLPGQPKVSYDVPPSAADERVGAHPPSRTAQNVTASPQRTPRAASAGPAAQSDATAVVLPQEQQAPIPRPLLTVDARLPGQPKVSYDVPPSAADERVGVHPPSTTAQIVTASLPRPPRAASAGPTAPSDGAAVVLAQEQQAHMPRPLLTLDARLPGQPMVSFDGGQLTIIVENSTISEVLRAVRESTGAEIELPPSVADERVWAHLGPGPARRVLAELLSSTSLDYVIQASDSDLQGIQRVFVTLRNKTNAVGATDRSETWAAQPQRGPIRRYPQPNPSGAEAQGQENAVAAEPANPGEPAPTVPASPTTREPAPVQSVTRTTEQMIQELKNMYQQRMQMQQSRKPTRPN